jgi:wyosine [tRNA(Phe)-imidazoG37] synthetase (radical SAM superfamily)
LYRYVFGPVRSRRLGLSLGVNNVPYKTCSYSCIYCQLGRTTNLSVERRCIFDWREIVNDVKKFVQEQRPALDYVTFVPDGEPTLDACIGKEIEALKGELGARVAVLTNASLLWVPEVAEDLMDADLVSLKVDAVTERLWRHVNRPHPSLVLERVLDGMVDFSRSFRGTIITETMLVRGVNTSREELEAVARFIGQLSPAKAYIAVPVRPPAEPFAEPATEEEIVRAYVTFSQVLGSGKAELITSQEPPPERAYGDPEAWLLNTISVHPLRYDYALKVLGSAVKEPERIIEGLVEAGLITKVDFQGHTYLVRRFAKR